MNFTDIFVIENAIFFFSIQGEKKPSLITVTHGSTNFKIIDNIAQIDRGKQWCDGDDDFFFDIILIVQ